MKMAKTTKEEVKKQIVKNLKGSDAFITTFQVSRKLSRSWALTQDLLEELRSNDQVEKIIVGQNIGWRLK